jgi:predicted dehydrogenase
MFENMEHLVLLDFAIHWFDILQCFMGGRRAKWVFAAEAGFSSQVYQAPSLASVIVQYPEAQARMSFNAHTQCGEEDTTTITGTRGVLRARGPGLNDQRQIEIHTAGGAMAVSLEGHWFEQGFQGTMGELLCALEEQREPEHSASNNLGGLELCLAALKSAKTGSKVSLSI